MEQIKLTRTGDPALTFTGEKLADAGGRWYAGVEQNRWHEVVVYKTAGGRYVVSITYRTLWQGETDHHTAEVVDNLDAVVAVIEGYLPVEHLLGYPPSMAGTQFSEKQIRLRQSLEDRYRDAVTEVLDALGITEHID